MATYQHIRSSTAHKRPTTSIADGQLAINTNTASPGLFFKDSAGTGIVKVGPVHVGTTAPNSSPAVGGSSGNYLGEQWLDTSVSPAQMKVWNGSAWVGIVADELPVSKLQDGAARQLIQTDAAGTGVEWTSNIDVPGTLDVTSTATFDSIAQHPLGTAGAPTITFTGDNNTGIYSPGADQLALSTNGTGRLFVDASGRVGVGTTPAQLLHISGSGAAYARIDGGSTSTVGILFNNGDGAIYYDNNTDYLRFDTLGGEKLRITSAGLVGIGTSAPQSQLHVRGSGTSTGVTLTLSNGGEIAAINDPLGIINFYSDDVSSGASGVKGSIACRNAFNGNWDGTLTRHDTYLAFSTATDSVNTEKVRITETGNVGIGTQSPSTLLHVAATGTSTNAEILIAGTNTNGDASCQARIGAVQDGALTSSALTFSTRLSGTTSERARIDSSGRLLVGTSSAPLAAAKLAANFGKAQSSGEITSISVGETYRIFHGYVPNSGSSSKTTTATFQFGSAYGAALIEIDIVGGLAQISIGRYLLMVDCDTASGQTAQLTGGSSISAVLSSGWNTPVFTASGASSTPTFTVAFTRATGVDTESWAGFLKFTAKITANNTSSVCTLTTLATS